MDLNSFSFNKVEGIEQLYKRILFPLQGSWQHIQTIETALNENLYIILKRGERGGGGCGVGISPKILFQK